MVCNLLNFAKHMVYIKFLAQKRGIQIVENTEKYLMVLVFCFYILQLSVTEVNETRFLQESRFYSSAYLNCIVFC